MVVNNSLSRILLVLILALASIFVAYRLPYYQALDFFAIQLSMLGGLFIAYAITHGYLRGFITELIFASVLLVCTLLGMWKWSWLIPAGFALTGIWSLLHRIPYIGAPVQNWFAHLCATYALLLAGFVYLKFFVCD